jgi:AraC-like DNA-binding protein
MCAFRSSVSRPYSNPTSLNGKQEKSATGNGVATSDGAARATVIKLGTSVPLVQGGRLRKILQKIESDLPRTIQDLALECNLSPSHLQHLFKQRTGLGLGRLLTEKRMQRAAELLAETDKSIKEIACVVGYEHTSSFTRAFERYFRQSPRCYRQTRDLNKILTNKRVG